MIEQDEVGDEMRQIREYYKYIEEKIQQDFKNLTKDTMQQIKNKLKRKQDKESQEENINLIEKERNRIIDQMKEHVDLCFHPHCQNIGQLTLLYNLFKGKEAEKTDQLTLIVRPNVPGLPKIETDCPEGKRLNSKMRETHRLRVGM